METDILRSRTPVAWPTEVLKLTPLLLAAVLAGWNAPALAIGPTVVAPQYHRAGDLIAASEFVPLSQASQQMARGQYGKALIPLIETVERNPVSVLGLYHLGNTYFELARQTDLPEQQAVYLNQAQQAFERVANLNNELTLVYFRLGKIALLKNDPQAAKRYYQQGILVDAKNAALIFNLARVHDQLGERTEAIRYYQQTLSVDPAFVFAYNNMGLLYEDLRDYQKAEAAYQQALKRDSNYNLARLNLGNLYAVLGQYQRSEKFLNDAQRLEPENEWVYYYLGNLWLRQGAYQDAVSAYSRALEINPKHATTYYLLAVSLTRLKRMDEALQASLNYVQLEPNGEYARELKSLILSVKLSQGHGERFQLKPMKTGP